MFQHKTRLDRRLAETVVKNPNLWPARFPMEKGFNSDISVNGITYHVQTEDWGRDNPVIVTRIFKSGAVLKSVKTSYDEIWKRSHRSDQHAIRLAMQLQHQEILDQLLGGKKQTSL